MSFIITDEFISHWTIERQRRSILKKAVNGLRALQVDSMWTKREFPTERMDKLMENDKAVYHEHNHTNSHLDHIPPQSTKSRFKTPAAQ